MTTPSLSPLNFPPDADSLVYAQQLDSEDQLKGYRKEFLIPKVKVARLEGGGSTEEVDDEEKECIYLASNSLGLLTKRTKELVEQELTVWGERGVLGHHHHPHNRPWVTIDDEVVPYMAEVVGAKPSEVAVMATLTSNLHFLLTTFYKPTTTRYKILMEAKAFPSDHYAVESQLKLKGIDPESGMILIHPEEGESTLREEAILKLIKEEGESIAVILLSGVQYYTGQLFDMKTITELGHQQGCIVGFDLAHAVGNVNLQLHNWKVDFACWCTYKYLSSGPGNIGGLFVHEDQTNRPGLDRLTGWWSHRLETRFQMTNEMELCPGAQGFRHSNPSVTNIISLLGPLELYHQVGLPTFLQKSHQLTGYLHHLLTPLTTTPSLTILTPSDPTRRGCQLSLLLPHHCERIFHYLARNGIICDLRKPDCIRIAPHPLLNSYEEVYRFAKILQEAIQTYPMVVGKE